MQEAEGDSSGSTDARGISGCLSKCIQMVSFSTEGLRKIPLSLASSDITDSRNKMSVIKTGGYLNSKENLSYSKLKTFVFFFLFYCARKIILWIKYFGLHLFEPYFLPIEIGADLHKQLQHNRFILIVSEKLGQQGNIWECNFQNKNEWGF